MIARFIVSSVAGGIVFFVLGYLIYGMALAGFVADHTVTYEGLMKNPPDLIVLAIGNLVWAAMIAFVADYWASTSTPVGGAKVGGILMFFAVLAVDLQNQAFMNIFKGAAVVIIVDVVIVTVMGIIAGAVIGFVIGKMQGSGSAG